MNPVLNITCPSCGAEPEARCKSPTGKPIAIHVRRIQKHRAEQLGPAPYDVLYLHGVKWRVVERLENGLISYRRGATQAVRTIDRRVLDYDAIAGMWRLIARAA